MAKYLLNMPDRQMEELRRVALLTGLTVAELLRRLLDHGMQEHSLNVAVPMMSGCLMPRVY